MSAVSGRDHVGQAARRDADGVAAQLVAHPPHQPFDHARRIRRTAPTPSRRRSSDRRHASRLADVDARQARRPLKQRVGGNLARPDKWRRRGTRPLAVTASNVVAVPKSRTMSGRPRPRPNCLVGGDAVHDAIGADLGRDCRTGSACRVFDAGLDDERGDAEVALHHRANRTGERRHDGPEDDAAYLHALERGCARTGRRPAGPARQTSARAASAAASSATSVAPSNTPRTMLVLPTSMARSIKVQRFRAQKVQGVRCESSQPREFARDESVRFVRQPARAGAPLPSTPAVTPACTRRASSSRRAAPTRARRPARHASRIASNRPSSRSS